MELQVFENITEVLEYFEDKKDSYRLIAEEVKDIFEKEVFSESEYEFNLIYRIKSADSIREKLIRNNYYLEKGSPEIPLSVMQDIIGLRIECKFNEEEKHAYELLCDVFSQTDDDIFYYMPSLPRLKLKLSEEQPQKQKNGFEIYKIDGYFTLGREKVNFEIQIKSLVNAFWSEIEHRVVYKNRDYNLSDTLLKDLFKSIKDSLNNIDSQLYLLYGRFHTDEVPEEDVVTEKKKERSIQIFAANMVYETFDKMIYEQLGFTIDFKSNCDDIVRYIMQREMVDELHEYGTFVMHVFNALDDITDNINLNSQITFDRELNFGDSFTQGLGDYILSMINTNFRWHLFFVILFSLELQSKEDAIEQFVQFYEKCIMANRSLSEFNANADSSEHELVLCILNGILDEIKKSQKLEYLAANGITVIHRALNYLLPLIRYDISINRTWDEIKEKYWDKFANMIKI